MLIFLLKGILRDKSRTHFPIIIVSSGVAITVLLFCWMQGMRENIISSNARFQTGHIKVISKGYWEIADQKPNDLALFDTQILLQQLQENYPNIDFTERIYFGGLLDVPDENDESIEQGFFTGIGCDIFSKTGFDSKILEIQRSLSKGRLPEKKGEILVTNTFANQLKIDVGKTITLISSTINGSLTIMNFQVVGKVSFGIPTLDKGAIIVDISDVKAMLDMSGATSEIFGFFKGGYFNDKLSIDIATDFNKKNIPKNEFSPIMVSLREQNELEEMLYLFDSSIGIISTIFIFVMSLILWNSGLMNGIRRYGEIGVRLAIGESKHKVYFSMILESMSIGIIGSILGTFIGVILSYYLQIKGLDVSPFMKDSSMLVVSVFRAKVTLESSYIGFIPGTIATILGAGLSGIGIYQRKTAQLFKELEV